MEGVGQFCYDYQEDFKKNGSKNCKIYNMPVIDYVGGRWRDLRDRAQENKGKAKIIMVGASSTFSLMHFYTLKGILPLLIDRLGSDSFEFHLVGKIVFPPDLEDLLDYQPVKLRGYVDDVEAEWLSSDILFVPTPIPTGSRTRIITGLSYGCCLVTTIHEQKTTPGLKHRYNALIAREEHELVDLIEEALTDIPLRRKLEQNARKTYEEFFIPEVSVAEMEEDMKEIVNNFQYIEN